MSEGYLKQIGVIYPFGFENKCCKDKPFLLIGHYTEEGEYGFTCECECNAWCTSFHRSPAEAIMEYEMMCRKYPECIEFNDPDLTEKYLACYPGREKKKVSNDEYKSKIIYPLN